eukprot:COSAG02_NODE_90_length_37755_cov_29.833364_24_plen_74_part_00
MSCPDLVFLEIVRRDPQNAPLDVVHFDLTADNYDSLGIFLEKTNMNNDDWYPGCQRERDIIEDKGKVPRQASA